MDNAYCVDISCGCVDSPVGVWVGAGRESWREVIVREMMNWRYAGPADDGLRSLIDHLDGSLIMALALR
jgi:hypothetical protein